MAHLQAAGLPPGMVSVIDPGAMGATSPEALQSLAAAQNPQIAKAFILGALRGLSELSEKETDPEKKVSLVSELAIQQNKLTEFNAAYGDISLVAGGVPQHAIGNPQAALDA